jgi:hypothetical protein
MIGWYFLREDRCLRYGDGRNVEVGKTYKAKGKLKFCENGMHASANILDALQYAYGPVICRVELIGKIIHDRDKSVARGCKVISIINATRILHEFACLCAEDALTLVENPDPRSIAAIQAKRDWLDGKISDENLDAARDAARAAARDAILDAAWVAARAAGDAAWVAARAAARDVVWDAARDVAWDAILDVARGGQNSRLERMVLDAMEGKSQVEDGEGITKAE